MSHSPSDYSELIEAILRDDRITSDLLVTDLLPKVILYLRVRMGAPESIAEECAYQAFSEVFEKIRHDKITDKKSLFKYIIMASRHEYLRMKKIDEKTDIELDGNESLFPDPPAQLELLLDQERQNQLRICMDKLTELHRKFILTFFTSNSVNLMHVAEKFGFSYAKTRTLKTRIMQELQQCIQKYK